MTPPDNGPRQDDRRREVAVASAGAVNPAAENTDDNGIRNNNNNHNNNTNTNNKKRKTRHGRAARRRNRKVRAIQEAEAALFGDADGGGNVQVDGGRDESSHVAATSVPSDRHRSLPGVMERRYERYCRVLSSRAATATGDGAGEALDKPIGSASSNDSKSNMQGTSEAKDISLDHLQEGDERMIISQLGFVPGNAVHVAARVADCPQLKLLESFGSSITGSSIGKAPTSVEDRSETEASSSPTVLKLYPLAIRDACPKRKYKSRQRGQAVAVAVAPDDSSERGGTVSSTERKGSDIVNNADKKSDDASRKQQQQKNKKPPRDWSVDNGDGIIEPFPTLYWLTDPRLRMLISKLEISDDNNVKSVETKIASNPDYLASMERAHRQYGQARWELLTEQDKEAVTERGWDGAVGIERGVSGIRNARGVKCLHAHAAHYLAGGTDNFVGRWTIDAVGDMLQEKMGRTVNTTE
mmetsp:Transcript_25968/g.56979  ORF Transcript_25968/g.56979 Transcript_25968/m.56979 type:complete len:469 (-) Transcript_25968:81-1487(-)